MTDEELKRIRDELAREVIDDAEELLIWFGVNGGALIDELLAFRTAAKEKKGKENQHARL